MERGIGETRVALLDGDRLLAARIQPNDLLTAGEVVEARLKAIAPRALALMKNGSEVLLPSRLKGISEGASLTIEIVRPALPGPEPWKRALGRIAGERKPVERLDARELPPGSAGLDEAGWDDLIAEAESGRVTFEGGELLLALTPAMTAIDVDGWLPSSDLAVIGAEAAARAVLRLDLQGSVGIDLPGADKAARQAAAAAIDRVLAGESFERTAVNGFGFLQLVRPRRRASLLELAHDASSFAARALLRRAGREHGAARLAVHPRVARVLASRPDWLEALARQRGGAISLREDASLAISGGHAEPA